MKTTVAAAGLLLGIAASLTAVRMGWVEISRAPVVRDIVDVDTVDFSVAKAHRESHFVDLDSIESLMVLPGNFDRAEALHAVCGRADSVALETLAYDALRIADPAWRRRALDIIFSRLSELAPGVAVDMAMSEEFSNIPALASRSWSTWAEIDVVAATAAANERDANQTYDAVQMIYAGIGGAYNVDARTVQDLSGIAPDIGNRLLYVGHLIDESPERALQHILSLDSLADQQAQIEHLAYTLADRNVGRAEQFAAKIDNTDLQIIYLRRVYDLLAEEDPSSAFRKQFASRVGGDLSNDEVQSLKGLAESDLDTALRMIESADESVQNEMAMIIGPVYAKEQPGDAIDWARRLANGAMTPLLQTIITESARVNPELALDEAQRFDQDRDQRRVTSAVLYAVAEESPSLAAQYLDRLSNHALRVSAARKITDQWLQQDAVGAIDWLLGSEPEVAEIVFCNKNSARHLDLDTALTLVPTLPEQYRATWARNIAERLIKERSAEDAYQFVDQFKGSNGYDMQLAHLIGKIADTSPDLAVRWSNSLPDGNARDAALSGIVSNTANTNPAAAAEMISQIADPDLRLVSASDLARRWGRQDPLAVDQWIDAMPSGPDRDSIIMNSAMFSSRSESESRQMIQSIDDDNARREAEIMFNLMNTRNSGDTEQLMQQLDELEMPEFFRQQMKAEILRSAARGD